MIFTIYITSERYLTKERYLCVYSTGIRNPEELSVMKFMDKDDLKKNIKEHLNTKKKRDSLHDQMPASNGVNHSNSGSLDRLSPYPNRSPAGPSPNVSTLLDFIGWCLDHCIAKIKDVVISWSLNHCIANVKDVVILEYQSGKWFLCQYIYNN